MWYDAGGQIRSPVSLRYGERKIDNGNETTGFQF